MSSNLFLKSTCGIELIEIINGKNIKIANFILKVCDLEVSKDEVFKEELIPLKEMKKKPIIHFYTSIQRYFYVDVQSPKNNNGKIWKSSNNDDFDENNLNLITFETNSQKFKIEQKKKNFQPLDRKYKGYQVNFNSVFTNPDMKSGFLLHLKKECNFGRYNMNLF